MKKPNFDNGTLYEMKFTRYADHTLDRNPAHKTFSIKTVSSVK